MAVEEFDKVQRVMAGGETGLFVRGVEEFL